MKKAYIIGVLITVALISINQMLIQYALTSIREDAKHINISGRQRMLSQKLNLEFYQLAKGKKNINDIKETFNTAQQAHLGLLHGSEELGLEAIDSPEVLLMLEGLNERYNFSENAILEFEKEGVFEIELFDKNQSQLLSEMDAIVNSLEEKSASKVSIIVWLEICLALISILIIALEVRYIYYPQATSLEKSNNKIIKQNDALKKIAWQQSHEVRKPVANILAISQLIKTDPTLIDSEKSQLLSHLEESTHELDGIIKSIVDKAYEIQQDS